MNYKFLLATLAILFPVFLTAQIAADDLQIPDSANRTDAQGNKTGYWIEKQGEMTFKGFYKNNQKVDNWVGFYPSRVVYRIESYSNGLKDGLSIQLDRKGKITVCENYKNGLLHGETIYYGQYNETPVSETIFQNGKKNGLYRKYADNGKIQEETYYKDDLKHGNSKWYNKSGRLIAYYNYKDGKFDGVQKTYYENDTLQSVNNYRNDLLNGESKEYFRNGKLKLSGKYVDGNKDGAWTQYDELGRVQEVIRFKDGQEIRKK